MSGNPCCGGEQPWRIRYTKSGDDLCAKRRKWTQPIVMANSEAQDCPGGGRGRDEPRSNARPDS